MIIVTGSVVGRTDTIDEVISLSLDHVHRSRTEPGCLVHGVHHDLDNPLRLVFLEEWADMDALRTHFAVPASAAFVNALAELTSEPPRMHIYEAERARV